MKFIIAILLINCALADSDETSFNGVLKRLQEANYRVQYNKRSAAAVYFYKDGSAKPFAVQSFVIPTWEMSKLRIPNFYEAHNGSDVTIQIEVEVNYYKSDLLTVYKDQRQVKFASIRVNMSEERVGTVDWDKDCNSCGKEGCMKEEGEDEGFCSYNINEYGDKQSCEKDLSDCKEACVLIIYIGWEGQAKGRYLKSYNSLPSNFDKYSLSGQFIDAAGEFKNDWLSF